MTTDAHAAIVAEAIAWAVARAEHWALVRATYRDTGLPTKAQEAAITAAVLRMADHTRRLHDLALAAATDEGRAVAAVGQMAMPMEAV